MNQVMASSRCDPPTPGATFKISLGVFGGNSAHLVGGRVMAIALTFIK